MFELEEKKTDGYMMIIALVVYDDYYSGRLMTKLTKAVAIGQVNQKKLM